MKKSNNNLRTLKLYWSFAWKYPLYIIGLFISVPLAILTFRFLPSLFVANIIDRIGRGDFIPGDVWGSFGHDLLMFAGLIIFGGIFLWRLNIYLIWSLEMRVLQDIHMKIFNHLNQQSANFHANRFGGSLVSQTNKFAGGYIRLADTLWFQILGLIVSFVFTIALLAQRAPFVVLFLVIFSLGFIILSVVITKSIRKLNAREASIQTKQTGNLADVVTNIMAVKSFSASREESKRYRKATSNTRSATNDVMWASLKKDTIFALSTTSLAVISLLIAVTGAVNNNSDAATIFLVFSYAGIIGQNLWDFSQSSLRSINRGLGDAQEMTDILAIEPEIKDPDQPQKASINRGLIEFKDVTFAHAESNNTLFKNLSLRIKPGEKIGLVGHSGSGKTTLTRLLLRFSDINSGEIIIDGQNITSITQDDLRKSVSYVPQEPLLFHRSLSENIAYGNPKASQAEIEAISRKANTHDFIKDLPDGYKTLVGERGVKLSGGQRQRVAIARAMLKNAPILVLDEATSALDSESESLIQDALWKLMEGRTAIVIAHRLSTIQKMDRIVVMDNGNIIEEGSHKELIRKNGKYAELWNRQSGGFIED